MILWRIASTARTYAPDDLSGIGAATYPGRWNDSGQRVIYAAPSLALAVLETAAHVDGPGLPMNHYVVKIDIPDSVWIGSRLSYGVSALPVGWDAIPSGQVALDIGSKWYADGAHLFLEVPSVIVPEERAVVINASLPSIGQIAARALRRHDYNALFRR